MKKYSLFLSLMLLATACGSSKETLKIYMWTDNIPQDVYADFTKETGIEIVEDAISSNEEIYAKIKASPSDFDIVTPSFDYAEIMMKEGLLSKISKEDIPNITNIDANIMKHVTSIDPNVDYIVPFAFGPTIIAYDTTKVTNDVQNFEIFSNPAYKGRMSLLNDMREVMGSALLTLGYQVDTSNTQELAEAEALIREWKSNILRFDSDAFQIAYANGEVDIIQGYPGTIISALGPEKLANTKFVVPSKGGMMWVDNFLLLKDAPNKQAALKFMNYIHRPDIYARIMDYIGSVSLNVPARDLVQTKSPLKYEDLERSSMLKAINEDTLAEHARIWENIQAQ